MEIKMKVEGMMCVHCASRVEDALKAVPGVVSVKADHVSKEVLIETNGKMAEDVLLSAVKKAGYEGKIA